MSAELDAQDIEVLLESLEYSKQRVRDAAGTPYDVRQQNLARLDGVAEKLRRLRDDRPTSSRPGAPCS